MTGPAAPQETGSEVFLEDFEKAEKEAAAAAAAPKPIEGEDIPAEFKGKTQKEIIEIAQREAAARKISEAARLTALENRANAPAPSAAAPAAPAPVEDKFLSEEEFDALYEENPAKAIRVMADQVAKVTERNVMARVGPLQSGAKSSAEAFVRQKYAEEFALLGDEIKEVAARIPNQQFLSSVEGWEEVLTYVRGRNLEKIVDSRLKKSQEEVEKRSRQEQISSTGFSSTRAAAPPPPPGGSNAEHHGLDETERKVADTLGQTYADYAKYKRMG